MPPSRWKTCSTPSALRKAVAFSQRMPPVQYMATLGGLGRSSRARPSVLNQSGNSRKVRVLGWIAPSKTPTSTS
ncbi:hypothetical protein D3C85_1460920 [compost metagenome]